MVNLKIEFVNIRLMWLVIWYQFQLKHVRLCDILIGIAIFSFVCIAHAVDMFMCNDNRHYCSHCLYDLHGNGSYSNSHQ